MKKHYKHNYYVNEPEGYIIDDIGDDKKIIFDKIILNLKNIKLNKSQNNYFNCINKNTITICTGPSGTSKTFTSTYAALTLLTDGVVNQIVLTKPIQEAGEELGFLPGDIKDKINPYMESYYSTFHKIIGKDLTKQLITKQLIINKPLAYLRGDNLDDSVMLFDEIQNADMRQIMLWITRIGSNSKAVGFGDISQYDINSSKLSINQFVKMIRDIEYVGVFKFNIDDIVRNPILVEIVNRYEKIKYGHDKNESLLI